MDTSIGEAWLSTGNELQGGGHCPETQKVQILVQLYPHTDPFPFFWSFQFGLRSPPTITQSILLSPGAMPPLLAMPVPGPSLVPLHL